MVVSICHLTFHLPGIHSLKAKRQIVRKLCERVRQRFSISIAEVGSQDAHQETKIGIALVGSDERSLQAFLEQILQAIEFMQLAPLVDRQQEILHYNEDGPGHSWSTIAEELVEHDDDSPGVTPQQHDPWGYMDSWTESPPGRDRKKGRP